MKKSFPCYLAGRSVLVSLVAGIALSSCGHSWSEAQKRSIPDVSMTSPTLAADSFKSADAVSLKTQRNAGSAAAGFGAAGGLIGALVGTAVAGSMTGVEGSNFRSK